MITLDDIDANVKPIIWGDTHSKRIAELEAQIAALTADLDAARAALRAIDRLALTDLVRNLLPIDTQAALQAARKA